MRNISAFLYENKILGKEGENIKCNQKMQETELKIQCPQAESELEENYKFITRANLVKK